MNLREATKEEWNAAVNAAGGLFTQSWEWGEFQAAAGRSAQRIIGEEQGERIFAQIIQMPLPRGLSYFYIPRGPLFSAEPGEELWQQFRSALASQARRAGQLFLRIDPHHLLSTGFPVSATQPQDTVVVDLTRPEQERLAALYQKTRYNLRIAQKKGVTVHEETSESGLATFLSLTRETAERHDIQAEPEKYYRTMFTVLASTDAPHPDRCMLKIFIARLEGKALTASLALFFGNTMTYAHGASSGEQKNVMAPYLLHWESMQYGASNGFTQYDFRGVAPESAGPAHPWAGITRFKEGFGGQRISWPQSADIPYRFLWYPLYRVGALLKHRKF